MLPIRFQVNRTPGLLWLPLEHHTTAVSALRPPPGCHIIPQLRKVAKIIQYEDHGSKTWIEISPGILGFFTVGIMMLLMESFNVMLCSWVWFIWVPYEVVVCSAVENILKVWLKKLLCCMIILVRGRRCHVIDIICRWHDTCGLLHSRHDMTPAASCIQDILCLECRTCGRWW